MAKIKTKRVVYRMSFSREELRFLDRMAEGLGISFVQLVRKLAKILIDAESHNLPISETQMPVGPPQLETRTLYFPVSEWQELVEFSRRHNWTVETTIHRAIEYAKSHHRSNRGWGTLITVNGWQQLGLWGQNGPRQNLLYIL